MMKRNGRFVSKQADAPARWALAAGMAWAATLGGAFAAGHDDVAPLPRYETAGRGAVGVTAQPGEIDLSDVFPT
jgi:hypothetical protein